MNNNLTSLLKEWHPRRDELDWVLATIIGTAGSSYRKAGAHMLLNSLGQQMGLLSGGCLEVDIRLQARKVMATGQTRIVTYDLREDDVVTWQASIGCGGMVRVQLAPIKIANQYLGLDKLYLRLEERSTSWYWQSIKADQACATDNGLSMEQWRLTETEPDIVAEKDVAIKPPIELALSLASEDWLISCIKPEPLLVIFGAGVDARPLVSMATELGWQVTLVDKRTGYAQEKLFPAAKAILKQAADSSAVNKVIKAADAAVVMTHNLELDAQALRVIAPSTIKYVGLLGPVERKQKLFEITELSAQDFFGKLSGPAGLDLGGELPESIALSILAECHAQLFKSPF